MKCSCRWREAPILQVKRKRTSFFGFTSFTCPGTIYRYDMDANTYTLYSQTAGVPGRR